MGNVFGSLFLISTGGAIGIAAAAFVVALAAGIGLGLLVHKKSYEKKVGEINQVVEKMLDDARAEGKTLKKEAILEAKEQELKLRNDFERESKEKRAELARTENRLIQKEDSLDKKEDALAKRNEELNKQQQKLQQKDAEMQKKLQEVSQQHEKMLVEIEKVSQMSREEAKRELVSAIEEDARKEAVGLVRNIEAEAKEEAGRKAKEIISLAIQKCSTEQASEITVATI